jgi:hypothetical protein
MRELQQETRDLPLIRILVWTGIFAATTAFWAVIGTMLLAWFRIG